MMSTNMNTYSMAHHTQIHKHGHTLSNPWTYVVPLPVHSPHSLRCEREREQNAKETQGKGGVGWGSEKCVPWIEERDENTFL